MARGKRQTVWPVPAFLVAHAIEQWSFPTTRPALPGTVRKRVPAQPVDATQALNFSAGVSNPRVLRGRSLSWRATLLRWACEYTDKSAPFGKYCLSRPLVFSLEPRCHGLCGSQK